MINTKVIIIGSGIAGLATAIRLAKKGCSVTVVEKNSHAGGKLKSILMNGYRFDAGPSLFTMPQYVEDLLAMNPEKDYQFKYHKLKTLCNYFFSDGTRFSSPADTQEFIQKAALTFNESPQTIEQLIKKSQFIYKHTHKIFIERSLHKFSTYQQKGLLTSLLALPSLGITKSMYAYYSKKIKNKNLVQYFCRYATYNGSNPYQAPATLHVIPYIEHFYGAYLPVKGMNQIPETLYKLAKDLGVIFKFNCTAEEILTEKNKIIGVKTTHGVLECNSVVSNSDIYYTYTKLLKQHPQPQKILNQEKSSSALIFYWGIKKTFKELDVHNIFFSENYQQEFNALFNEKHLSEDPTVYIHISSKLIKEDAPENCENWFVMINAPANYGQNWEHIKITAREKIINKLSKTLNRNIEELIEVEQVLDPIGIDAQTGSHRGSLYGSSSNNRLAAFFRHPNFSSSIKGLYFCGGSVHPGGGIPMCLMSAKIIDENFVL